jgi:CubicO group peptidase (beta-lactamase class C family)
MTLDMAAERLPRVYAEIMRGMEAGWHRGAQVYVSRGGQVAAEFTVVELDVGESRPGVPITRDTLVLWLSSGKPVGSVAILQLRERGKLELDDPVCNHLPEFAGGGKQAVTIRHLLTHTGGFRWVDLDWAHMSWDQIIAKICAARLERGWVPGERAGYHPTTSWYILGELVRRIDGRPYSQYVREEIFEPLGLHDCWIGMPLAQYQAYGDRLAIVPDTSKPDAPPQRYSSERGATQCVPGGNGVGPMRQLARFYEMLLAGGTLAGVRILLPDSVRLMTTPQRVGMFDETFKHVMDWGLGTIINSNRYGAATVPYGYGPLCSDRTFGHGGSQSSSAFADLQYGLVVAAMLNGMPGEKVHDGRMRAFHEALYRDLGLG